MVDGEIVAFGKRPILKTADEFCNLGWGRRRVTGDRLFLTLQSCWAIRVVVAVKSILGWGGLSLVFLDYSLQLNQSTENFKPYPSKRYWPGAT